MPHTAPLSLLGDFKQHPKGPFARNEFIKPLFDNKASLIYVEDVSHRKAPAETKHGDHD